MNRTATLTLPTLALALAAFLPAADEMRFAPEEGSSLTKTFVAESKMTSESFRITMDGREIPAEMIGDLELTIDSSETFEFSDEYQKLGKGRPDKLKRTIEKAEGKQAQNMKGMPGGEEGAGNEQTEERVSKLAGKTVMFTWNAEKDAFDKKFHESQGDDALLEKLEEDIDLRGFLPEKGVAEGDTWDIEPKAFNVVVQPGGDLAMAKKDEEASADKPDGPGAQMAENLKGKAKATYKGTRDVDGVKCGVIEIKAELETSAEFTPEDAPGGEAKAELKATMELEGEVLWDLAGGHVHAADIHGSQSATMKITASMEMGGQAHSMIQEIDLGGDVKTTLKVSK